jgi:hypothetical protein
LLLYFDADGECLADTWHKSVEGAKEQTRFEFEIEETDWKHVSDERTRGENGERGSKA